METPGCLHCWTQIPQIFLSWSLSCLKFLWMWRAHVWESVAKQSKPYIKYDKDGQTIVLCPDIYITLYIYPYLILYIQIISYSKIYCLNWLTSICRCTWHWLVKPRPQDTSWRWHWTVHRRADSSFWFEGFLRFQNLVQHYYDSYKMFIHLILQQLCCTTFDHASNAGASSFPVVESLLMTKCSMTLKHVPPARGNRSVCMSILYSSHIGLEVN